MFCCPYLFCLQNYDHPFPTQFWKGQNKELVSRIGDELDASQVTVSFVCVSHSVMSDLMDCSSPGSSVYGILQARILERVAIPFSRGFFLTQESNLGLPHCRQILYHLSNQ